MAGLAERSGATASLANSALDGALAATEARYLAANPGSQAAHLSSVRAMPGGNTRTVLHFSPYPLTFARGEGCWLEDLDGHRYRDFLGEYSAGLYGHSHPVIRQAMQRAIDDGIVLGGPNRYEGELAALLCDRFPSLEQVRFTNSGTEANLLAISAARHATGREAVLVFEGAYHGGVLYFGQHKSPINAPYPWVFASYNDLEGTRAVIAAEAARLAAIVIEPMMGSGGGITAEPAFLAMLREEATRHGIVLIFDEVMTSRMSSGGLQKRLGVTPDMTTLGKYLGGGASFGAFGGLAELMAAFDPRRADAVSHAGTFNNNVISMAAGLAGLRDVFTPAEAERLFAAGEALRGRLNAAAQQRRLPVQALGVGSIIGLHFKRGAIRRPQDEWPRDKLAAETISKLHALLHLELIERGVYTARRGYMTLSLPMTPGDVDAAVAAYEAALDAQGEVIQQAVE